LRRFREFTALNDKLSKVSAKPIRLPSSFRDSLFGVDTESRRAALEKALQDYCDEYAQVEKLPKPLIRFLMLQRTSGIEEEEDPEASMARKEPEEDKVIVAAPAQIRMDELRCLTRYLTARTAAQRANQRFGLARARWRRSPCPSRGQTSEA